MMRNSKTRVFGCVAAALFLAAFPACVKYEEMVPGSEMPGCPFPIKIYVDDPTMMSGTRSSFTDYEMGRLTDVNVFVYREGKLLEEYGSYHKDASDVMLSIPAGTEEYDIYMLGNVGKVEAPERQDDISGIRHVVDDYGEFRNSGVPVAGVFAGYRRGDMAEFPLKRLVGQFDIRMSDSAERAEYRVKDVRVMNCARDVYPFSENTAATMFLRPLPYDGETGCDLLTDADVMALDAGKTVSLYFVENLQGELLAGNTDPKVKIPSSLPAAVAQRCTYVEITADVVTPAARYTDCRYRFYPGKNETTDFSIVRNTLYDVFLDFTQNMVHEQDWRIEADCPEVADVFFTKDEITVSPYRKDTVYVYSDSGDVSEQYDFTTSFQDGTAAAGLTADCSVVTYDGKPAYMIVVSEHLDGVMEKHAYGNDPYSVTAYMTIDSGECYNGFPLVSKHVRINRYDAVYPLLLKLERPADGAPYHITLRGYNPMKSRISVSADYVYGGKKASVEEMTVTDVSLKPVFLGSLNPAAGPGNLTRIDFTVKVDGVPVEFGDDCRAHYGPGADMYPAKYKDMPDDGTMSIVYTDDEYSIMPLLDGEAKDVHYVQCGDTKGIETYFDNSKSGVNSRPVTEGKFYFLNGCLESYRVYASKQAMVKYPDKAWRGSAVYHWGPGRDLFPENARGDVIDVTHTMGFWITTWKNLVGKIKSVQESQYYSGQLYMTINNCSCWPGGDVSSSGYFSDTY